VDVRERKILAWAMQKEATARAVVALAHDSKPESKRRIKMKIKSSVKAGRQRNHGTYPY